MVRRLKLHQVLENVLESKSVYYQPPESLKLQYPCIVYRTDNGDTSFANNMPYVFKRNYNLILITRDPDSDLVEKLAMALPGITLDRTYTTEGLNHYVYSLYY